MALQAKAPRAGISWEGDSREVLRAWPKAIRNDFGTSLDAMQEGKTPRLPIRPMPAIAAGVFELKDDDENRWYRLVYLARVKETIYVLHCFEKDTAKTEKRDLAIAEKRWKHIQERLREVRRNEKHAQRGGKTPPNTRKRI